MNSIGNGVVASGAVGFLGLLFLELRRRRVDVSDCLRLPVLASLDLMAAPLTAGLGLALVASLYPEVARTGLVQLHSPAVVALALCVVALPLFWMEGRKQIQYQRPVGLLFAEWLIFAGGGGFYWPRSFPGRSLQVC